MPRRANARARPAAAADSLVDGFDNDDVQYFVQFSLRNACVTFYEQKNGMHHSMWISRQGVTGIAHGFSEYVFGYQRISVVRAERRRDAAALARCEQRPLAIGIPFSCNNLFHATFHAVPAWEAHAAAAQQQQAPPPTFVPIVYSTTAVGRKMSTEPRHWHAWEYSVRAFSALSAARIADDTAALLAAPCTCFARVEANAPAFNPNARAAAPRLRAFTAQVIRSVRAMGPAATGRALPPPLPGGPPGAGDGGGAALLYIARGQGPKGQPGHAKRLILNAAALEEGLRAVPLVRHVALEPLSLAQQMALFDGAAGLLTVHGQAMAWVLFLPSHRRRVAALEIFPGGSVQNIYRAWCQVLGVRYKRLTAPIAGGCKSNKMNWLACNVTVDVPEVVRAAHAAAGYIASR